MKTVNSNLLVFIVTSGFLLLTTCNANKREGGNLDRNKINLQKSGEIVLNPGQGWILYDPYKGSVFSNLATNPSAANINALRNSTSHGVKYGDLLDLCSTGYGRYSWRELQSGENSFNWSKIDKDIAKWAALEKSYAFGVFSVSTHEPDKYTFTNASEIEGVSGAQLNVPYLCPLPEWLIRKGMKFTIEDAGSYSALSKIIVPVWDDPVYVAECKRFAQALAEKYDGNPNIAFIDIRNYGNWGEMHMWPFEKNKIYKGHLTDAQIQNLLIQPYIDAFKNTQLAICVAGFNKWVVNQGIALRYDTFMSEKDDGGKYDDAYGVSTREAIGKTPVIWETTNLKELWAIDGWDNSPARRNKKGDDMFMNAIKDNKPNYIGMGQFDDEAQFFYSKKSKLIREAANLIGFNFSMKDAGYKKVHPTGEAQEISLSIENTGTTVIMTGCVIKLLLLSDKDEPVASFTTDWNAKSIDGGKMVTFTANVEFDGAPAGRYKLATGFYRNENDPKPAYNLDNKGRTKDGWYVIGSLTLE